MRRRLLLLVVSAVAGAVAALVVGFNLLLANTLDGNARDLLRSRAAAQLAVVAEQGHIPTGETPDAAAPDAGVWVLSRGRVLERPQLAEAVDRAALNLARGPGGYRDVPASDVRLYAVPVVVHGRRTGSVVVSLTLAPYEETRTLALVSSLVFGGLVLALVAFAARWLLTSSLRPVTRMTRQAAAWSERDLDHRFGLGEPRDELTELAATLDDLLDRIAASLRREQRFSAELSHELRTPLARVIAETELALRRDRNPAEYRTTLALIKRNAEQLTRTVDALVAAARFEAGSRRGTADAYAVAEDTAAACSGLAAERGLAVTIEQPARPMRVGVERDLAERILQPVLENACRYATTTVSVDIDRNGSSVRYAISDDGPGVGEDERERIFEPGVRGTAANGDGSGLGLALARRLAESVAGEVKADSAPTGGRFLVQLPAG
jgi:two-component system, OmpR family, sensor kinase